MELYPYSPHMLLAWTEANLTFLNAISLFCWKNRHWNLKFLCTLEFLDNGATCNTSLVNKGTFSTVLKIHTLHFIHSTFRKLLFSSSGEHVSSCLLVRLFPHYYSCRLHYNTNRYLEYEDFHCYLILWKLNHCCLIILSVLTEFLGHNLKYLNHCRPTNNATCYVSVVIMYFRLRIPFATCNSWLVVAINRQFLHGSHVVIWNWNKKNSSFGCCLSSRVLMQHDVDVISRL